MKTQSAYLQAPWRTELRDIELDDVLRPGWVRIRVESCGLCGTDLTAAEDAAKKWHPFGHEVAGVVEAVGPEVHGLGAGTRVVLESGSACGRCELCRDGRADLCTGKTDNFWGQPAMGFSRHMLVPAVCCVPYEGLTPAVASLAEPVGVAVDLVKTADIQLGDRVAVVGPGPIALAAVALAVRRGASRVLCIGRRHSQARLALAAELGAETRAVDGPLTDEKDLACQFDHVLMTAPTAFIVPGFALLAYGGRMSYIGIGSGDGTIAFDANDFHFRKLQLRASFASPAMYFPTVLRLLRAGAVPGARLISHTFPLSDIQRALLTAKDNKTAAIKIVVTP
jgi:L-iditol 2-dehydrogenase